MASTTMAVLQANAIPIYADVDAKTFQLDADRVKEKIGPRTKAVISVGLYGLLPDMVALTRVVNGVRIALIEDNAEALGAKHGLQMGGSFGDFGSFSFQSSKHLTSGEGGMLITDSEELAARVRRFQSLGYATVDASKSKISKETIQDPTFSRHAVLGWNYRMPEVCAAVLCAQLERVDELLSWRRRSAETLIDAAKGIAWLRPQFIPSGTTHTYWTAAMVLSHPKVSWREFRDTFRRFGGDGIYAAWRPTYLEPFMKDAQFFGREKLIPDNVLRSYAPGLCPVAEELAATMLQFKTSYWDEKSLEVQAHALRQTIDFLEANI
jgi:perosamine synthetase